MQIELWVEVISSDANEQVLGKWKSGLTFHYRTNLSEIFKYQVIEYWLDIFGDSFSIWPGTHHAAQAGFEFMDLFCPKSLFVFPPSKVLGNMKRFTNRELNA